MSDGGELDWVAFTLVALKCPDSLEDLWHGPLLRVLLMRVLNPVVRLRWRSARIEPGAEVLKAELMRRRDEHEPDEVLNRDEGHAVVPRVVERGGIVLVSTLESWRHNQRILRPVFFPMPDYSGDV